MTIKINPFKRKLIQICAFAFCNPHVQNFFGGKLYTGKWKNFCTPGLNCYSCPAATFSCPIGAMQAVNGSMNFSFSFYVTGIILAFGIALGRLICGFLCPFGLIQELLHKIPSPKLKLPKWTKYIKFVVLIVFVLILPVASTNYAGSGDPAFCKYICPAGTLEGGLPLLLAHEELQSVIGTLFFVKLSILIFVIGGSILVMRFFCKTLCPLGAIYGLLNKVSFVKMKCNTETCVSCGLCEKNCPMDVNPSKKPNSMECIRCGKCISACPHNALKLGF